VKHPSHRLTETADWGGLLLSAVRAGDMDQQRRPLDAKQQRRSVTNASSVTLTANVGSCVSWTQICLCTEFSTWQCSCRFFINIRSTAQFHLKCLSITYKLIVYAMSSVGSVVDISRKTVRMSPIIAGSMEERSNLWMCDGCTLHRMILMKTYRNTGNSTESKRDQTTEGIFLLIHATQKITDKHRNWGKRHNRQHWLYIA